MSDKKKEEVLKPFPNEHAARLQSPGRFDRFRRVKGGTIFGRIKVPKTVGVVWGHIKGGKEKAWAVQTLRFLRSSWTVKEAKKWLKDHNIKPMLFEPAKPKTRKKILDVHKALHFIWGLDEDGMQSIVGEKSRDRVTELHEEAVRKMDELGMEHGSILFPEYIKKENTEEFDPDEIIEYVFVESLQDFAPLEDDEETIGPSEGEGEEEEFYFESPIVKVDKDERMVYGIVLEPNIVDAQKDFVTAPEIRKTAHDFMENTQKIGLQHEDFTKNFKIMESYIAPTAFTLGKTKIKKGTWLMAVRVLSDDVWKQVKAGEITGFSIGGTGTRIRRKLKEKANAG